MIATRATGNANRDVRSSLFASAVRPWRAETLVATASANARKTNSEAPKMKRSARVR